MLTELEVAEPARFVEVEIQPLKVVLEGWEESRRALIEQPSAPAARNACFVSQQTWLAYHDLAAPFVHPKGEIAETGRELLTGFAEAKAVIDTLIDKEGDHDDLGTYAEKIGERVQLLEALLEHGREAVRRLALEALGI